MGRLQSLVSFWGYLFSLIALASLMGLCFLCIVGLRLDATGPSQDAKPVWIPEGTSMGEVASLLRREGIISSEVPFFIGATLRGAATSLQAGEFLFHEHATGNEVLDILIRGKPVLHGIVVPEGLMTVEVLELLRESEVLSGKVERIPPEGVLLPDTYHFTRGTSRQAVLDRMQRAQERKLRHVWERRAKGLPLKSPRELVILASIVEEETAKAGERSRIAAVFINRLRRSMRLQADPTVLYGILKGGRKVGRDLLRSDLRKTTPYNTYKISGLPPTPICNPGLAALEATANPARTDDLYFVADGSGGHVFASTLKEHNRNVVRWRRLRRKEQERKEQE